MHLFRHYKKDFLVNLKLASPIIAGQIGQVFVNIADNVMVGKLGAASLAAVSLANAIFIGFLVVGMGISFALPPLISKEISVKNYSLIAELFRHSLIINLVFAILAIIGIEFLLPTMVYWKQQPEVVQLAIPYLRINAYSLLIFMGFQTFRTYADGMSETLPPMIAMLVANVINVITNYMFIYGNFGAPKLGVKGAAVGTFIARIVMFIILVLLIFQWKTLKDVVTSISFRQLKMKYFRQLLNIGIPTSLQGFFEVTAFGAATIMAGAISKEAQAAHQIAINLASISFLICSGLAMVGTIRVGNQLGLKNYLRLKEVGYSVLIQVATFMVVTSFIYISFRHFFPSLYINNQDVITIAAHLLLFASIFQLPDGLQVAGSGLLRGMQDVYIPTVITFLAFWILALPIAVYLAFYTPLKAAGIWIGLSIGLTCTASLMVWRFHRRSKQLLLNHKKLEMLETIYS